ncbi:MAG: hypothetical protein IJ080_06275 [Oscillospiraceae bacterium]|nr:hypothetical protein [Oscillospiraceae bacterium]MBQ8979349.1 hypothetical protein [Oscillospiraceae bacterium]
MNTEMLRAAFDDLPADSGFYAEIDRWTAVYEGKRAASFCVCKIFSFALDL